MSFHWSKSRRVYLDDNGNEVSAEQIREWMESYIDSEKEDLSAEAAKMVVGGITAAAFFSWMRSELKAIHGAASVIAYGGEDEMDEDRWQRVEEKVVSELEYLTGFRTDVESEQSAPAWEEMLWPQDRATLYADSIYSSYANAEKAREADAGVLVGRRVCENDESSCQTCIDAATSEYIPLDEILDVGDAECLSRCRCWVEFSYEGIEPIEIDRATYVDVGV